jgi:hypothetical protein
MGRWGQKRSPTFGRSLIGVLFGLSPTFEVFHNFLVNQNIRDAHAVAFLVSFAASRAVFAHLSILSCSVKQQTLPLCLMVCGRDCLTLLNFRLPLIWTFSADNSSPLLSLYSLTCNSFSGATKLHRHQQRPATTSNASWTTLSKRRSSMLHHVMFHVSAALIVSRARLQRFHRHSPNVGCSGCRRV